MATRLRKLTIKEISGVDDPANTFPGWILMKAREAGVDPEEVAAEMEDVLRAHSAMYEAISSAMSYLEDAPDDVKAAAKTLMAYMRDMEMEEAPEKRVAPTVIERAGEKIVFDADAGMEGMRMEAQVAFDVMMRMLHGSGGEEEGPSYHGWVRDVARDGGSALVEHEGKCFVVPLAKGEEGVEMAPMDEWQEVEQVWVAKGVTGFQDLPLTEEDRAWDAGAARKRIREWAGGDDFDPDKMRKAFLWVDADAPNEMGSYKLPIADVVDGVLKAVPRGVFAAAGGRGYSAADISAEEVDAVKRHLARYYKKMGRDAPWETEKFRDRMRRWLGLGEGEETDIGLSREEAELILAAAFSTSKRMLVEDLSSFGRGGMASV